MDASKPVSAKQLKEHLQHQQEPFSLHSFLSERGYMFKNFSSDSSNIHGLYSAKNLKASIKCDLHNVRKRLLQAKGILRSVLYKFILTGDHNQEFTGTQTRPKNGFSSLKRLAASDNFTCNDVEDTFLSYEHHSSTLVSMFQTFTLPRLRRLEVDTVTKHQGIGRKRNKQQYIRELKFEEPLPNAVCHSDLSQKSVGDPIFSTYLRKLLMKSDFVKMGHTKNDKLQMFGTMKRILQKRKQLLFGCVEKAKEFHENEGKNLSIKTVSELEDLENIIHEHFCWLEKQYGEVKKTTTHLLLTESFITKEEWRDSDKLNGEIYMEIGDAIMDDTVKEIIDLFLD